MARKHNNLHGLYCDSSLFEDPSVFPWCFNRSLESSDEDGFSKAEVKSKPPKHKSFRKDAAEEPEKRVSFYQDYFTFSRLFVCLSVCPDLSCALSYIITLLRMPL